MIRYPRVFFPDLWPSGKTKTRLSKTWKLRCFKQHNSGYRVPIKLKTGYCIWMGYHETGCMNPSFFKTRVIHSIQCDLVFPRRYARGIQDWVKWLVIQGAIEWAKRKYSLQTHVMLHTINIYIYIDTIFSGLARVCILYIYTCHHLPFYAHPKSQ